MGVPVIAANTTALAEIVVHGENGLLFTNGKSKELAQHIERVLEDENLREHLVRNGRALLASDGRFNVERMCRQHEELYAKLFAAQSSAR